MVAIMCKECRVEHPRSFYGSFVLGPFEAGQSLTIANTLRRTLLSTLPALSIQSVQIYGAAHEYAHLQGVQESVVDLLLNLKQVAFRPVDHQPPVGLYTNNVAAVDTAYVHVRGPGVVQAQHLQLPPHIQCIDPDQPIATLMEDGVFKAKFWVGWGPSPDKDKTRSRQSVQAKAVAGQLIDVNRMKAERLASITTEDPPTPDPVFARRTGQFELNTRVFSVQRVQYTIHPSEIWPQEHDVTFEIWTNGTLHPRQALALSCQQTMRLLAKVDRSMLQVRVSLSRVSKTKRKKD